MAKQAKLAHHEPDTDAFEDMYGSNWLSPDDIKKAFRTTIEAWERQTFNKGDGKEKDKMVLTLKGVKKQVVLNKTNALNLATMYGKDPSLWVGKPVLVKVEMTAFQGKPVKGVRLFPVDLDDMGGDTLPDTF
jgi:hypothetical protein